MEVKFDKLEFLKLLLGSVRFDFCFQRKRALSPALLLWKFCYFERADLCIAKYGISRRRQNCSMPGR